MAGLMDFFGQSEDPNSAAMMQMAAALLAARDQPGATLGGALGRGLLSGMQGYGQAKSAAEQRKRRQMEMEDYEQARADKQAARESAKQFQELQRQAFTPQMTFDTSKIMGNDYGSIATSSKPVSMQQGLENLRGLLAQSGNVQGAMEVEKQLRDMRPKVKDYREIRGEGGNAQIVGFDEYGQPVMTGQTPWKAPERLDLGGQIAMLDPATMRTIQQYQKSMTPGESASNAVARANLAMRQAEFRNSAGSAGRPQWDATRGQYVYAPDAQNPMGRAVTPAGIAARPSAGGAATEDERKAAGWLSQANNAWKNMQQAMASSADSKRPGLIEAMVPDAMKGAVRGADRQKFVQAASSLAEATLRAATGAGVTRDEAQQKINELTPQYWDSPEVISQKMASIPVYLDSLKARAGRAALGAPDAPTNAAAPTGGITFAGWE